MHDFDGVICVFFTLKLYEAVALVLVGDFVSGNMDVDNRSALSEKLPQDVLIDFLVDVS